MLNIALPKGRLGDSVYALFKKVGYTAPLIEDDTRLLVFTNTELGIRFFSVKPSDVAIYTERGVADIAVAGLDILEESGADVYELLDLGLGKCRMAVASLKGFNPDNYSTLRVATKFESIAKNYYAQSGKNIDIIHLNGSIELAPILGLSDCIVDIVESGKTLKENGLVEYTKIMDISARLIANKGMYRTKEKQIITLVSALKSVLANN